MLKRPFWSRSLSRRQFVRLCMKKISTGIFTLVLPPAFEFELLRVLQAMNFYNFTLKKSQRVRFLRKVQREAYNKLKILGNARFLCQEIKKQLEIKRGISKIFLAVNAVKIFGLWQPMDVELEVKNGHFCLTFTHCAGAAKCQNGRYSKSVTHSGRTW